MVEGIGWHVGYCRLKVCDVVSERKVYWHGCCAVSDLWAALKWKEPLWNGRNGVGVGGVNSGSWPSKARAGSWAVPAFVLGVIYELCRGFFAAWEQSRSCWIQTRSCGSYPLCSALVGPLLCGRAAGLLTDPHGFGLSTSLLSVCLYVQQQKHCLCFSSI